MLDTTALLVALSATGLMGHNKGCGGRVHHARHHKVTYATVAPTATCGTTYAQPILAAAPRAIGQAPASSPQAASSMPRPMASPSAPLPPDPAEAVPQAPAVPAAPAPPAPTAS